jgi:hypothetical protein
MHIGKFVALKGNSGGNPELPQRYAGTKAVKYTGCHI